MKYALKKEGKFSYTEIGEGRPIIILHGLMGGLSNFDGPIDYFSKNGYKLVLPKLPVYDLPLLNTNVKNFALHLRDFIEFKGYENVILLGNSLGGHIGLYYTNLYPNKVAGLVITGSSGLYESAMGGGYTKRSDYNVIKAKAEEVFYDPASPNSSVLRKGIGLSWVAVLLGALLFSLGLVALKTLVLSARPDPMTVADSE